MTIPYDYHHYSNLHDNYYTLNDLKRFMFMKPGLQTSQKTTARH